MFMPAQRTVTNASTIGYSTEPTSGMRFPREVAKEQRCACCPKGALHSQGVPSRHAGWWYCCGAPTSCGAWGRLCCCKTSNSPSTFSACSLKQVLPSLWNYLHLIPALCLLHSLPILSVENHGWHLDKSRKSKGWNLRTMFTPLWETRELKPILLKQEKPEDGGEATESVTRPGGSWCISQQGDDCWSGTSVMGYSRGSKVHAKWGHWAWTEGQAGVSAGLNLVQAEAAGCWANPSVVKCRCCQQFSKEHFWLFGNKTTSSAQQFWWHEDLPSYIFYTLALQQCAVCKHLGLPLEGE